MCRYCTPIDEGREILENLFEDYSDHAHGAVFSHGTALIDLEEKCLVTWANTFEWDAGGLTSIAIRCCPLCGAYLADDTPEIVA